MCSSVTLYMSPSQKKSVSFVALATPTAIAKPLPWFSWRATVRTPSKVRAISTVRSSEPSLTTMTSSMSGLLVSARRTSAIVFSSL